MHGQAINIMIVAAMLLAVTVFNERLFALNESAGCMGCHQGESITTIDEQADKPNDNPQSYQASDHQKNCLPIKR